MQKWYQIFPKNTGLSLYVWIIFCILPFYFIFKSSSKSEIISGIVLTILFFFTYRLSFTSRNWFVYVLISIEMVISIYMTLFFGFVYFSLFLAFFIGNLQSKVSFFTFYIIHLVSTLLSINIGFFIQTDVYLSQWPFIIINLVGVILLPISIYNKNKRDNLEALLENANTKLLIIEERQRIARDLHDTLGQKLSLIGLKSDLARKLIATKPNKAKNEIEDIHTTARSALKEVREMVSNIRGVKLVDEITRVQQLLHAAQIDFTMKGNVKLTNITLLVENVLSMCLKEAVTNIVNHSQASACVISVKQNPSEIQLKVQDNGIGMTDNIHGVKGYGLRGIKERLEFINGTLEISSLKGTTLIIRVPNVIKQSK